MDWLSGIDWLIDWIFGTDPLSGMDAAPLEAVLLAAVVATLAIVLIATLAVVLFNRVSRR